MSVSMGSSSRPKRWRRRSSLDLPCHAVAIRVDAAAIAIIALALALTITTSVTATVTAAASGCSWRSSESMVQPAIESHGFKELTEGRDVLATSDTVQVEHSLLIIEKKFRGLFGAVSDCLFGKNVNKDFCGDDPGKRNERPQTVAL